jgi:hypothetical protein
MRWTQRRRLPDGKATIQREWLNHQNRPYGLRQGSMVDLCPVCDVDLKERTAYFQDAVLALLRGCCELLVGCQMVDVAWMSFPTRDPCLESLEQDRVIGGTIDLNGTEAILLFEPQKSRRVEYGDEGCFHD